VKIFVLIAKIHSFSVLFKVYDLNGDGFISKVISFKSEDL